MLRPGRKNLTIPRGDDFGETYRIRYRNEDGSPGSLVPLAGWSSDATLFLPDGTTLPFTVNIDAGASTISIFMDDLVTAGLPEQNCSWRMRLIDTAGKKMTYLVGDTYQSQDVFISG